MGRFREPATLVLAALRVRPLGLPELFDAVRASDGPIGHGTLLATTTRLERLGRIRRDVDGARGRPAYRITERTMETPR